MRWEPLLVDPGCQWGVDGSADGKFMLLARDDTNEMDLVNTGVFLLHNVGSETARMIDMWCVPPLILLVAAK
jgi:hypothetical protein